MGQLATVGEMVDEVERAVCDGFDLLLRTTGEVQAPTVHMFVEGGDAPYLGCVTCRRFYAGDDAARAVAQLGELPGTVEATRLLVTWEAQDLNVALQAPVDPEASAVVVLDATLGGQVLRWYPLRLSRAPWGYPAIVAEWGPLVTLSDPPLPHPMVRLLALWRLARGGDLDWTLGRMESGGYRVLWAPR